MHSPIADCLNALRLVAPIVHGRLAMHPLLAVHDIAPDYFTLDEAMDQGLCEVRELTEGGHVNRLVLVNRADRPVLLLDTDLLVSAKQNRVINLTWQASARGDTEQPVSGAKQGRWSYTDERRFYAAKEACYARARAVKAAQVTANKRWRETSDDQGVVWDEIRTKCARMAVHSPIQDMTYLFSDREDKLERQVMAFAPSPRKPVRCSRSTAPSSAWTCSTARALWPESRPAGHVAMPWRPSIPCPPASRRGATPVADFLDDLKAAKPSYHRAPGLGEDVQVEDEGLGASALLHAGRFLHLFAYANPLALHKQDR